MSVVDIIKHYQRSIEKYTNDERRILYCIGKLEKLPIKVNDLQDTGVGRTVNSLRKYEGAVGHAARTLVAKWKEMVAAESSHSEGEPEPDVDSDPDQIIIDEHGYDNDNNDEYVPSTNNYQQHKKHENDNEYKPTSIIKDHPHKSNNVKNDKSKHPSSSSNNNKYNDNDIDDQQIDNTKKSSSSTSSKIRTKHIDTTADNTISKNNNSNSNRHNLTTTDEHKHKHKKKNHKSDKDKDKEHKSNNNNINDNDHFKHKDKDQSKKKDKDATKLKKDSIKKGCEDNKNKNSSSSKHHKSSTSSKHHKSSSKHKNDNDVKDKNYNKRKLIEIDILNNINDNELRIENDNDSNDNDNDNDGGISFTTSGKSFADALGGACDMLTSSSSSSSSSSSPTKKKLKINNGCSSSSQKLTSTSSSKNHQNKLKNDDNKSTPDLLAPNIKLPSLNLDITLPTITPNYQPSLSRELNMMNMNPNKHNNMNNSTIDLSFVITSQKNRTKVYSGNKNVNLYTQVPTLYELCIRVLQDNIDALAYTGGVPYTILLPILERCTPDQLFVLEHYNAYLLEDTDILWQQHCKTHFKSQMCKREEFESWRDAYQRFMIERDHKLKLLTQNIKQSIHEKQQPIRQTKLAYVDSNFIKPPRSIARKQAKYGTASSTGNTNFNAKPFVTPASRVAAVNSQQQGGTSSLSANVNRSSSTSSSSMSSSKPKKAPLMQKTLALIKSTNRYRR